MKVTTIGDLKDQVTISSITYTDDGMGGHSTALTPIATVWASVNVPRSRDGIVGGRELDIRTHEVIIRMGGVEPVQGDTVTWRGKALIVKAVREDYGNNRYSLDCIRQV